MCVFFCILTLLYLGLPFFMNYHHHWTDFTVFFATAIIIVENCTQKYQNQGALKVDFVGIGVIELVMHININGISNLLKRYNRLFCPCLNHAVFSLPWENIKLGGLIHMVAIPSLNDANIYKWNFSSDVQKTDWILLFHNSMNHDKYLFLCLYHLSRHSYFLLYRLLLLLLHQILNLR